MSKTVSKGDIICCKLISGEEIIGRLDNETKEYIEVNQPLAATLSSKGIGMIPWLFLGGKDTVQIKHSHILAMVECKKDAADQYISSTTGIDIGRY